MILVAAGYGSFRSERGVPVPKVIEQVRNIPMIAYPLRNASEIGIRRVAVVVNPRDAGHIHRAIEYSIRAGIMKEFPEIVVQPSRAGSADAVRLAIPVLRKMGAGRALISYGDMPLWHARTFRELTYADAEHVTATMVTVQRDERFPVLDSYGRILRAPDRTIRKIIEVNDPAMSAHERTITRVNPSLWIWDLAWLEKAVPGIEPARKTDGFGDERHMPPLVEAAINERRVVRELALSPARSKEALGVNTAEQLKRVQRFKI